MSADNLENVLLEVCIASLEDAIVAVENGAGRLEVNAALELGGLTPSGGLLSAIHTVLTEPAIAMIRPRPGGFLYSDFEFSIMLHDAGTTIDGGVGGVAFGVLHGDGTIDMKRCRMLRGLIDTPKQQAVFHRAFDLTPDPFEALEQLIELGFTRVMTSGQKPTAMEGAELIRQLIERAAGRIEVLPAGGIRPHNVRELIEKTGCTQLHASLRSPREDRSGKVRREIRFSKEKNWEDDKYDGTDGKMVEEMVRVLRGFGERG